MSSIEIPGRSIRNASENDQKYASKFVPSKHAEDVLRKGRIISKEETPAQMVERVVNTLMDVEKNLGTSADDIVRLKRDFGELLDGKFCVMSTPILTNAGRYLEKPLSACTVPQLDFVHPDLLKIKRVITEIHREGMGTGFSLDASSDPVHLLGYLNQVAIEGAASGREDRPVGNMATLSVYHPNIREFIQAKVQDKDNEKEWKFNISVDCDEKFFECVELDKEIKLRDGTSVRAREIFDLITDAAFDCADPGLIFLDRMEKDNPTPVVGHYISTAPCAGVGLTEGESCQFGYINLGKFIQIDGTIDISKLKKATRLMTRALDNALEISIHNYSESASSRVMSQKRKIGIGVCGLADLFVQQGVLYSSPEARKLALDLVTLINYESKVASHELAAERGSCQVMSYKEGNEYFSNPNYLEKKYGQLDTEYVKQVQWIELGEKIKETGAMRNVSTTALPPTGRSALVIDASTGIEPIFSLNDHHIVSFKTNSREDYLETAKAISPENHLLMAASLQQGVDESISKTVNLPANSTKETIRNLYIKARKLGLKGISVYRDGAKGFQPKALS